MDKEDGAWRVCKCDEIFNFTKENTRSMKQQE